MAIANSHVNATANAVGASVQLATSRAVVHVHGNSVMDGASVVIKGSSEDTAAKYSTLSREGDLAVLDKPEVRTIEMEAGMWIRVDVENAGDNTDVSVDIVY